MFTETASRSRFAWSADPHAREYAALWRAAIILRDQRTLMDSLAQVDVTSILGDVRAPTLVLQRQDRGIDVVQRIADGVADGRVVLFPGGTAAPYLDDADEVWSAIAHFLGHEPSMEPRRVSAAARNGMCVILFTDIVGSTALTERLGDAAFHQRSRALHGLLRETIARENGRVAEGRVLGDGVMALFDTARSAIVAGLQCREAAASLGLDVHLGIHAGDVITEEHDVHGGAVNIAARICGASAANERLVSETVRGLARTSAGVTFEDRGTQDFKGVTDPLRVYAVKTGST